MFLPVLLVRDFGLWAWVVFALPNIVGAAAMGFVLRDVASSQQLIERNKPALVLFSRITIAYQAFFAGWMVPQLIGWWTVLILPLVLLMLVGALLGDREFSLTSALVFLFSIGVAVWLGVRGHLQLPPAMEPTQATMLAPVCLLGFMLCPYLDLTFHRAFQKAYGTGGLLAARGAFAVGFGVVFASMIVLTLFYARGLLDGVQVVRTWVGAHMLIQLTVTTLLHHVETTRALGTKAAVHPMTRITPLAGLSMAVGLLCLALSSWRVGGQDTGWQVGEYVYRTFLAAYGLLFPAIMLMQVLPGRARSNRFVAGVCLVALPFYAWGFFASQPAWTIPGVLVIVVAGMATLLKR